MYSENLCRIIFVAFILLFYPGNMCLAQSQNHWKIHDRNRPEPPVVSPGTPSTPEQVGTAPSDAIVLFDGKDLSAWQQITGEPAHWKVENGYLEVVAGSGSIRTRQGFGDCQLHIEWATPVSQDNSGQGDGNSGVYLMNKYELQVLNSYRNKTYADGQAAAIYGQYPPLVNSSLPPGQWQRYDIIFHRPHFDEQGNLLQPARFTVLHNGILVHDHVALLGPTEWQEQPPYQAHPDRLPIMLQDHGDPVRYRNIWVRDLEVHGPLKELVFTPAELKKYAGNYQVNPGSHYRIEEKNGELLFYVDNIFKYKIYPESATGFFSKKVDALFEFQLNAKGDVEGLIFDLAGSKTPAKKVKEGE